MSIPAHTGMPDDKKQRSAVHRLAKSVSMYMLARVAAGAVRLLAVPLIVHVVSPEAFGTLATLWITMLVVHGLGNIGLGTAALRLSPECKSESDRAALFATMLWTRALAGTMVTAVIVLAREPLSVWLTGTAENENALMWLALARPFSMVADGFTDALRAREDIAKVSGLVLLGTVFAQGLSVLLVVGFRLELDGLVWGRVLGEAVAFIAGAALCIRFAGGRPSVAHARRLITLGWPFGALYVLGTLHGLDRPLIRKLLSVEHVAAYELGMRLVGPVGLFNIALAIVLEPVVYTHSQSRDTPAFVELYARVYIVVFATLAMALSVVGPEIVAAFAPEPYRDAARVLPSLAFSAVCEGFQRGAGIGADLAKKTRIWATATLLTIALGLTLAAVFTPRGGITGTGFAWIVANTAATLLVYRAARAASGIVLPVGRGLFLIVSGAMLGTAAAWVPLRAIARFALLVGFGFAAQALMRVRWKDVRVLI